ncbi:MAG: GNAT family N-acetyltransferase [Proteobacteria bacterium]|nr:MAG: GNAT family N-acetyltransferase [Pseudomonadota bacterium]
MSGVVAEVAAHISAIAAADWNGLTGSDNPFVQHEFLRALEDSGSVGADTGWQPYHLLLRDATGALIAASPMYLKSHSYGEYVFDHAWANAYGHAGGEYYPKLQIAAPFTPVTGPRLLARTEDHRRVLAMAAIDIAKQHRVSSLHVAFPTEPEWQLLGEIGFLQRLDSQYHWLNDGYGAFDDFLGALASRKRKVIRRERKEAVANIDAIDIVSGNDLREAHWDAFFRFYMDTGSRKWGRPYLNRQFFSLLSQAMADRMVLILARRGGRYVAGALNLRGGDTLYGRYWGAVEEHPFLHFELCYYQAMDYAIAHKLARVEAGAQGEHKIARGYLPAPTYSAHWIAHPGFRDAVAAFLERERQAVAHDMQALAEFGPFKLQE